MYQHLFIKMYAWWETKQYIKYKEENKWTKNGGRRLFAGAPAKKKLRRLVYPQRKSSPPCGKLFLRNSLKNRTFATWWWGCEQQIIHFIINISPILFNIFQNPFANNESISIVYICEWGNFWRAHYHEKAWNNWRCNII